MLNNYFTLDALLKEEKDSLEGFQIVAAYSRIESTLSIVLEKPEHESITLIISCAPRMNYLFFIDKGHRQLTGANVFHEIVGARILSAHVENEERIVILKLSGSIRYPAGTSDELSVAINLFGTHANVYLVDNAGGIVSSFLKRKIGNALRVNHGFGKRTFPESADEFGDRWQTAEGSLSQKFSKVIPSFGGELSKEAFYRLGGEEAAFDVSREHVLKGNGLVNLFGVVSEMRRELLTPRPRIYFKGADPVLMSLIDMNHLVAHKEIFYDSVNSCIGIFVSMAQRRNSEIELKNTVVNRIIKQKEELQATISRIEQDLSENREEKYRMYGEILMQHLNDIEKGASSFLSSGTAEIPLDPKLPSVKNAQQYFEKSKKARESRRLAIVRKEELKIALGKIEGELRNAEGEADHKELLSIERKKKDNDEIPFRQFEMKGYKIYVGKDAKNNDRLTFGFAKPNDIFLHARGVSGSHVIIRNSSREFPQKPILQFAASIAAHYSKARTSGIVPVVYSMRKFVKKAKGKPGAVLLDREEVILVKPEIPLKTA